MTKLVLLALLALCLALASAQDHSSQEADFADLLTGLDDEVDERKSRVADLNSQIEDALKEYDILVQEHEALMAHYYDMVRLNAEVQARLSDIKVLQ